MPYLSDDQISRLSKPTFIGKKAIIENGDGEKHVYYLQEFKKHGGKGLIWKARGTSRPEVALKLIPQSDYLELSKSILGEILKAQRLSPRWFAEIYFYGSITVEGEDLGESYYGIEIEWVDGTSIEKYAFKQLNSVDEFLALAKQLLSALGELRIHNLCHDDLHMDNILIKKSPDSLTGEIFPEVKIIDTGTIKTTEFRKNILDTIDGKIKYLEKNDSSNENLAKLKEDRRWKTPDDHLRVIDCFVMLANALYVRHPKLYVWEKFFLDQLLPILEVASDPDLSRRLDNPSYLMDNLDELAERSKNSGKGSVVHLHTPFDFPSAEMFISDQQFYDLFSDECAWIEKCKTIEPLWIYGPRGSGKSSVLRYLSIKSLISSCRNGKDSKSITQLNNLREIGIYLSCSVELRSKFWLFPEKKLLELEGPIIKYFNLLLLEELFDTLAVMTTFDEDGSLFCLTESGQRNFCKTALKRMITDEEGLRLQGLGYFEYLRNVARRRRWNAWEQIINNDAGSNVADPSLAIDVTQRLSNYFKYFSEGVHVTYLIDDYSNQRIPRKLQEKLNQTITFAKQATPLFKVTSEYFGLEKKGVEEGREVIEVNIGEQYTNMNDLRGKKFLADILDRRLRATARPYKGTSIQLLGDRSAGIFSSKGDIADSKDKKPQYFGLEAIHGLCSGDVALVLNLVRELFTSNAVTTSQTDMIPAEKQHRIIRNYSHEEVHQLKYIPRYGPQIHDIIVYFGAFARVIHKLKSGKQQDRKKDDVYMTHIDIDTQAITKLKDDCQELYELYDLLRSRAILFSLETSFTRYKRQSDRLQIRRIYLPTFFAPLQRKTPVKIDSVERLELFLREPREFFMTELETASLARDQLSLALEDSLEAPTQLH